jgi:hypothetical protein
MRGFLIGLLVAALLVILAFWAGWLDFSADGDGREIDINKEEFKQDIKEAGEATGDALEGAGEAVDDATDEGEPSRVP